MSSSARRGAGAAELRVPEPSDQATLQAIWDASLREDDPTAWPGENRGWSIGSWASETRVLVLHERPVGVVAVRAESAPDGAMPGRVALASDAREPGLARALVDGAVEVVRSSGGAVARLFVSSRAGWLQSTLHAAGFQRVRTIAQMLLPARVPTPEARTSEGWRLRSIEPGEDRRVLAALNRAWAGTWNFVEITPEMLSADLRDQRDGMLLGVVDDERIIATCHAVFDAREHNPDGGPHAWISNLTVDPEFRGKGIARTMLARGIAHLRKRGARSVTLGVDADDPAPFSLYRSVGFEVSSSQEAWDAPIER